MAKKPKSPITQELAQDTHVHEVTSMHANKLITNPDTVLTGRAGGDYQVYRELLRDDQVHSVWQQRTQALIGKELAVSPGGDSAEDLAAAEALEENLRRLNWDEITRRMLYGRFYGYAVGECIWEYRDGIIQFADIKVRKASRFRWTDKGELGLLDPNGTDITVMPEKKFWTYTSGGEDHDNPYGLGLAHQLYWPVFFKRNGMRFWLVFLDKFGSPTVLGKAPKSVLDDKERRDRVMSALKSFTSDSTILVEETVVAELLEASRGGTADYSVLQAAMDRAIAKIVLSQTMTTDSGSSRSQAEVHLSVRDDLIRADADLISESFSNGPAKWWTEWNFPNAAPPRVKRLVEAETNIGEQADLDIKLSELGWEPTEERIRDIYGDGYQRKELSGGSTPGIDGFPQFAEMAGRIAAQKIENRSDQQSFVDAARTLALDYDGMVGDRVRSMLAALEETGDLLTFRERLNSMAAEPPADSAIDNLRRAGMVARLMGYLRGQK